MGGFDVQVKEGQRYIVAFGPQAETLAMKWFDIGKDTDERGNWAVAESGFGLALRTILWLHGPSSSEALALCTWMTRALHGQGELPGTRSLQEYVLEAQRRLFGPEHPDTLTLENNLTIQKGNASPRFFSIASLTLLPAWGAAEQAYHRNIGFSSVHKLEAVNRQIRN